MTDIEIVEDGLEWNPCPVNIHLIDGSIFIVPNNEAWTYTQNGVWCIGYFQTNYNQNAKSTVEIYSSQVKFIEYDIDRMHEGYVNQLNEQLELPDVAA